jgi:hypothetical protein
MTTVNHLCLELLPEARFSSWMVFGLAISVAFLYSAAVTVGFAGHPLWWELATLDASTVRSRQHNLQLVRRSVQCRTDLAVPALNRDAVEDRLHSRPGEGTLDSDGQAAAALRYDGGEAGPFGRDAGGDHQIRTLAAHA